MKIVKVNSIEELNNYHERVTDNLLDMWHQHEEREDRPYEDIGSLYEGMDYFLGFGNHVLFIEGGGAELYEFFGGIFQELRELNDECFTESVVDMRAIKEIEVSNIHVTDLIEQYENDYQEMIKEKANKCYDFIVGNFEWSADNVVIKFDDVTDTHTLTYELNQRNPSGDRVKVPLVRDLTVEEAQDLICELKEQLEGYSG